eukprot:scaffold14055_cov114-Isochrysis_galbana.AAC.2
MDGLERMDCVRRAHATTRCALAASRRSGTQPQPEVGLSGCAHQPLPGSPSLARPAPARALGPCRPHTSGGGGAARPDFQGVDPPPEKGPETCTMARTSPTGGGQSVRITDDRA